MTDVIVIENKSRNLGLENRLVQFVEEEMNGVLIDNNKWKCDLMNSSLSREQFEKEIAFLVNGDPKGVVLWFRQKGYFWQRERWTRVDIHSGREHSFSANTKELKRKLRI